MRSVLLRHVRGALLAPALALAGAACGDSGGRAKTAASPDVAARALSITDHVLGVSFELEPERAALLRLPGTRYDDLPGETAAAYAERRAREDAWLEELTALDVTKLPPHVAVAVDVARERLEASKDARVCHAETWTVSQTMNGWQVRFGNLAAAQPVGTPELRAQAIARWSKMPAWIDAHVAQIRKGLREGRVAPEIAVKNTLEQIDILLAAPPSSSPLSGPAERDPDPAFRAEIERVVSGELRAATMRYRDLLANEVLPRARKQPGLASLPDGQACYRAMLRAFTTLSDRTPEKVHAEGKAQLEELRREMRALSAAHFGGAEPRDLFERFRSDPKYFYRDREDVIAEAEAAYERAAAAMPRAFGVLPRAPMVIEPIPAFQEKKGAAHYLLAAVDGSRPATYRIRTYRAEKESRVDGESTAFHEGIPGHHLQLAVTMERAESAPIVRFSWSSAFGEGWALYAERLADELGLFSSPEARFGMLSAASFRAARLVVDTGLHAFGWERERAVEELLANTPMSRQQAESEVDRYIAWPGQATAYMTGYLVIRELRRRAETELGPRFDLRAFHDAILETGSAPLPVVERRMKRWSASR